MFVSVCLRRNLSLKLIVKAVWMLSALRMPTLWEQHGMMGKQHILLGRHEQSRFNLHFKTACESIVLRLKILSFMCSYLAKWHSVAFIGINDRVVRADMLTLCIILGKHLFARSTGKRH